MASEYDSLLQAVSDARQDYQEAWARVRESKGRVVKAEREFVDWLVENNQRTASNPNGGGEGLGILSIGDGA